MAGRREITDTNLKELLVGIGHYYEESLEISQSFGGPSEYFHRQAILAARNRFLSDRHVECIYAVLPAWGMHRMGDTKTKMVDFEEFRTSVLSNRDHLEQMRCLHLALSSDEQLHSLLDGPLRTAFTSLDVSVSDCKLVANSKALHHILPDLVPPIDRQHTIRFFYYKQDEWLSKRREPRDRREAQRKRKKQPGLRGVENLGTPDEQHAMFKAICLGVRRVLCSQDFQQLNRSRGAGLPFNTSLPKIADNMIVAFVREKGKALIAQAKERDAGQQQ